MNENILSNEPDVKKNDIVYTPNYIAFDIIKFFKPSGKCLDPCKGKGAFLQYLPQNSEWCEIRQGRNFFDYHKKVDWIISNPPFSDIQAWMLHSFKLADNIVYLLPTNKPFNSDRFFRQIYEWGGIKELYQLGSGRDIFLNFNVGFGFGAYYFKKGYRGDMRISFRKLQKKC